MNDLELEPKVLHKDHIDDVLLKQTYPILPAWFRAEEKLELDNVATAEDLALFDQYYQVSGSRYVLASVPWQLSLSQQQDIEARGVQISDWYRMEGERAILESRFIPLTVMQLLAANYPALEELASPRQQGLQLQQWFRRCPQLQMAPVFSYLADIDTGNYFFYRKTHEHVPGLMLIEMARQAMYHYVYSWSGYSRGEVSISMNSLKVDFSQYVISPYELEILVSQSDGQGREKPKTVDKTASFYQAGQQVASIRLEGAAMNMKLFKRLRNIPFPNNEWFQLSEQGMNTAILTDAAGSCSPVRLLALGSEAVRLESSPFEQHRCISLMQASGQYLILPLAERGVQRDDCFEIGFASLGKQIRADLQELIKCKGVLTQRDLLMPPLTVADAAMVAD